MAHRSEIRDADHSDCSDSDKETHDCDHLAADAVER